MDISKEQEHEQEADVSQQLIRDKTYSLNYSKFRESLVSDFKSNSSLDNTVPDFENKPPRYKTYSSFNKAETTGKNNTKIPIRRQLTESPVKKDRSNTDFSTEAAFIRFNNLINAPREEASSSSKSGSSKDDQTLNDDDKSQVLINESNSQMGRLSLLHQRHLSVGSKADGEYPMVRLETEMLVSSPEKFISHKFIESFNRHVGSIKSGEKPRNFRLLVQDLSKANEDDELEEEKAALAYEKVDTLEIGDYSSNTCEIFDTDAAVKLDLHNINNRYINESPPKVFRSKSGDSLIQEELSFTSPTKNQMKINILRSPTVHDSEVLNLDDTIIKESPQIKSASPVRQHLKVEEKIRERSGSFNVDSPKDFIDNMKAEYNILSKKSSNRFNFQMDEITMGGEDIRVPNFEFTVATLLNKMDMSDSEGSSKLETKLEYIRLRKESKKNIEKAILHFNNGKQNDAIDFLRNKKMVHLGYKFIQIDDSFQDAAKFLYYINGLDKLMIGEFLSKNKDYNKKLLAAYCGLFEFKGKEFDISFRTFLSKFRLPKEAQMIQRLIEAFSSKYYELNKEMFPDEDSAFTLSYSILLLNTDLHSDKIPKHKKMTKKQFINNNRECFGTLPEGYLQMMYDRILTKKLETKLDEAEILYKRMGGYVETLIEPDKVKSLTESLSAGGSPDIEKKDSISNHAVKKEMLFTKYGRYGKPKVRRVILSDNEIKLYWHAYNKKEKPRYLLTPEIIDVLIGATHTKIFKKQKIPNEYDNHCLSIITKKRTLDLRNEDPRVIKAWFDKIKQIIARNENKKSFNPLVISQKKQSKDLMAAISDVVWRSEILVNWSNYWDYKNHKPKNFKISLTFLQKKQKSVSKQILNASSIMKNTESPDSVEKKKIKNLSKELTTSFYYLWLEGIPYWARRAVWPIVIGNHFNITKEYYEALHNQIENMQQQFFSRSSIGGGSDSNGNAKNNARVYIQRQQTNMHKLERDASKVSDQLCERYPGTIEDADDFYRRVILVLRCFLTHRPEISYVKGMSDIVGHMMMFCDEYDTFQSFINLSYKYFFFPLFTSNMAEVKWRMEFFEQYFEKDMPDLYQHFKTLEFFTEMFLYDWFLALFTKVLPFNTCMRVWDIFFLNGEIYAYQVALGILKYVEKDLLNKPLGTILKFLKSMPTNETFNDDEFFEIVNETKISAEEFDEYLEQQNIANDKAQLYKIFL